MTSTDGPTPRAPGPLWHDRPPRRRNAIDVRGYLPGFHEILAHAGGQRLVGSLGRLGDANDFPPFALAHPVNFRHPEMNFELAAFQIGREPTPPLPAAPSYPTPPPARAGFTRSLQESDILVCPNCEHELGVGEDDVQRQVWIIRSCGHVRTLRQCLRSLPLTHLARYTVANVRSPDRRRHRSSPHDLTLQSCCRNV